MNDNEKLAEALEAEAEPISGNYDPTIAGHLVELTKDTQLLTQLIARRDELKDVWLTWKYQNHDQEWYNKFVYEQNVAIKDAAIWENIPSCGLDALIASSKNDTNAYDAWLYGEYLVGALIELIGRIPFVEQMIDQRLKWFWFETKVPCEVMRQAYDPSMRPNTFMVMLTRRSWYKPRRTVTKRAEELTS